MKSYWTFLFLLCVSCWAQAQIRVGSKAFTEGYLVGELAAQKIELDQRRPVERRFGLGNTGIVYEALLRGEIDVYSEYTGTIAEAILFDPHLRDVEKLRARLSERGLVMSSPLGFNNSYGLAVREDYAAKNKLTRISDLRSVSDRVRTVFSHEFVSRADGLSGLQKYYGLNLSSNRQAMEHSLAFEAISAGHADVIEVYTTDAKIESLGLRVLQDDRGYFPAYQAVFLARQEFIEREPEVWASLQSLAGTIDEKLMRNLNAQVEVDKKSFAAVVAGYLNRSGEENRFEGPGIIERVWLRTQEHLQLVGLTMFFALLTGIPLGIAAARSVGWGRFLLLTASLLQTIPALALLSLLVPFFGIGFVPAFIALYLYSLLPILLNTHIGLRSIDPKLIETARAIGLSRGRILWSIELPLASRSILGGIKTATVISIGTATLAALIGAGGYGAPIISGLAINDMRTVLLGAIPAAGLSLLTYFGFELVDRWLIPRSLKRG